MTLDLAVAGRLAVEPPSRALPSASSENGPATPEDRRPGLPASGPFSCWECSVASAGWLIQGGLMAPGVLLLGSGVAPTVAAYVMTTRHSETVDGTTEVAALVVLAIAAISTLGYPRSPAAGGGDGSRPGGEDPDSRSDRAAGRGGASSGAPVRSALVILPVPPEGPYGPYDSIKPRAIWVVVLLFSALNFAGYLIGRWLGASRGYAVTGLLGGLVSSTAVTWQFARRSKENPELGRGLALGVVGACTVLAVRVGLVATLLQLGVALPPPIRACAAELQSRSYRLRPPERGRGKAEQARNPLRLGNAIRLALAFQTVVVLLPFVQHLWGSSGVLASAAFVGLTDVDALTYSITRMGGGFALELAATAIAIGVLSNTALKLVFSLALGRGEFRRIAGARLVTLAAASGLGLWLGTRWRGALLVLPRIAGQPDSCCTWSRR